MLPVDDPDTLRFLYSPKASRAERNRGLDGMPEREGGVKNGSGRGFSERDPYAKVMTQNHHPTVKPLAVMRWLLTLVTPPGGVVFDPFAGSGTTGVAAAELGIACVLAEMDAEYCEIIARRIDHALDERAQCPDAPATLPLFAMVAD